MFRLSSFKVFAFSVSGPLDGVVILDHSIMLAEREMVWRRGCTHIDKSTARHKGSSRAFTDVRNEVLPRRQWGKTLRRHSCYESREQDGEFDHDV